jgi:hypothetical protein
MHVPKEGGAEEWNVQLVLCCENFCTGIASEVLKKEEGKKIYRNRAVAGIGRACGPGASPTPDLREPARDAPTYT